MANIMNVGGACINLVFPVQHKLALKFLYVILEETTPHMKIIMKYF